MRAWKQKQKQRNARIENIYIERRMGYDTVLRCGRMRGWKDIIMIRMTEGEHRPFEAGQEGMSHRE